MHTACIISVCVFAVCVDKSEGNQIELKNSKNQNKRGIFDTGYGYGFNFDYEVNDHDFPYTHEQKVLSKTIIK